MGHGAASKDLGKQPQVRSARQKCGAAMAKRMRSQNAALN